MENISQRPLSFSRLRADHFKAILIIRSHKLILREKAINHKLFWHWAFRVLYLLAFFIHLELIRGPFPPFVMRAQRKGLRRRSEKEILSLCERNSKATKRKRRSWHAPYLIHSHYSNPSFCTPNRLWMSQLAKFFNKTSVCEPSPGRNSRKLWKSKNFLRLFGTNSICSEINWINRQVFGTDWRTHKTRLTLQI